MHLDRMDAKSFSASEIATRVWMWVNKFPEQTSMAASFPNSPNADDSLARYREAMKSM
jgi:mycolipenoyl-CoA---2-(long-chain-fatty acyl)-trehalose mycolipenoyltransferase / long-chain-acyl-CoA---trehalose acyltransferase